MFGIVGSEYADKHLDGDLGHVILQTTGAMICISALAVLSRFWARLVSRQKIQWDDWAIVLALFFSWAVCVLNIVSVQEANYGRHLLTAKPSQVVLFEKMLFGYEISWILGVTFVKLSIIAFYRRVFSVQKAKWPLRALEALVVVWAIASTISILTTCIPLQGWWDKTIDAKCQNIITQYLATAIPDIVTDLLLAIFPIPLILGLQMARTQKLAVLGVFAVGGLVIFFSSIRVVTIEQARNNRDLTYALIPMGLWNVLESCIGIVLACLPSTMPLFRSAYSRIKTYSKGSKDSGSSSTMGKVRSFFSSAPSTDRGDTNSFTRLDEGSIDARGPHTTVTAQSYKSSEDDLELGYMGDKSQGIHVKSHMAWQDSRR